MVVMLMFILAKKSHKRLEKKKELNQNHILKIYLKVPQKDMNKIRNTLSH